MKKVSLKIKLTLLYTIFILVVVGTVLGILFSLSGREILASTKMSLERRVEESLEEIEMQDGELKIDSDFYSVENGVYLSMYDSTGYFLYGKIPGVLCLLRTIFLETTYASCSGSTPASISNFVFLRIFGAFKASPSLSPTLPMKR